MLETPPLLEASERVPLVCTATGGGGQKKAEQKARAFEPVYIPATHPPLTQFRFLPSLNWNHPTKRESVLDEV